MDSVIESIRDTHRDKHRYTGIYSGSGGKAQKVECEALIPPTCSLYTHLNSV